MLRTNPGSERRPEVGPRAAPIIGVSLAIELKPTVFKRCLKSSSGARTYDYDKQMPVGFATGDDGHPARSWIRTRAGEPPLIAANITGLPTTSCRCRRASPRFYHLQPRMRASRSWAVRTARAHAVRSAPEGSLHDIFGEVQFWGKEGTTTDATMDGAPPGPQPAASSSATAPRRPRATTTTAATAAPGVDPDADAGCRRQGPRSSRSQRRRASVAAPAAPQPAQPAMQLPAGHAAARRPTAGPGSAHGRRREFVDHTPTAAWTRPTIPFPPSP